MSTTRDIKSSLKKITEQHLKAHAAGEYKLPVKKVELPEIIGQGVSKISSIVKKRAVNFLTDKPVTDLDYEFSLLLEQIWNDGYKKGLAANKKIEEII